MELKVCGLTDIYQLHQLEEMGVHYAGFIFYPPSPRHALKRGLSGSEVKRAKVKMIKVGVFVDASYDEVMKQIDLFGLDMVQLHGHETPYTCSRINGHIELIKAFRFAENDHLEWTIKDYYEDADMFLFDTGIPVPWEARVPGAPVRNFNWNKLKDAALTKPFFLSGGIEPTDVEEVKRFMQQPNSAKLVAVDINSRFEILPGIKDMEKIRSFKNSICSRP